MSVNLKVECEPLPLMTHSDMLKESGIYKIYIEKNPYSLLGHIIVINRYTFFSKDGIITDYYDQFDSRKYWFAKVIGKLEFN